jgi:biotin synthase
MVATARIVLPASRVRLSAGRMELSDEAQALCFLAGANSIFTGDKLLTTPNPGEDHDVALLEKLGLSPLEA